MTPKPTIFLTTRQIQRLYARYINRNGILTQPSMLESATHSPVILQHYTNQNDIFQLAGNLTEKIIKNNAYMDGNKRTGCLASSVFLGLNGQVLPPLAFTEDVVIRDMADAHVSVATGR